MSRVALAAVLLLAGCPSRKDADRFMEHAIAKMTELTDQMCVCKDKACADHVQEAMTKWATDIAKDSSKMNDRKPTDAQMKRMADVATKYAECMTKAMPPAPVPEPVPEPADRPPRTKTRDADALIRSARDWMHVVHPQLSLSGFTISYVDASGVLDEEHGRLSLGFDHPNQTDDPKRKTGAPVLPGTSADTDCLAVTWDLSRGWETTNIGCFGIAEVGLRCSVPAIWKRSIAMGDPADALATIEVRVVAAASWHFRIEDEPRNVHIAHMFPDDCPLAVEK